MAVRGFSIFCDDIREEVTGKFSLIGCYDSDLIVHEAWPAVLPKFCIYSTLVWDHEDKTPDKLDYLVHIPERSEDDPLIFSIPKKDFVPSGDLQRSADTARVVRQKAIFSPFFLQAEGFVKVRFRFGETIIRAGGLRISAAQQG